MIFFGKPVSTFPDHALTDHEAALSWGTNPAPTAGFAARVSIDFAWRLPTMMMAQTT
jgi:hypothetical protein